MKEQFPGGREERPLSHLDSAVAEQYVIDAHAVISNYLARVPDEKSVTYAKYPFLDKNYTEEIPRAVQAFVNRYREVGIISAQEAAQRLDRQFFGNKNSLHPLAEEVEKRICQEIEMIAMVSASDGVLTEEGYLQARQCLKDENTAATISQRLFEAALGEERDTASFGIELCTAYFFTMLSGDAELYGAHSAALQQSSRSKKDKTASTRVKTRMMKDMKVLLQRAQSVPRVLRDISQSFFDMTRTDYISHLKMNEKYSELAVEYNKAAADLWLTVPGYGEPRPVEFGEPVLLEPTIMPNERRYDDGWAPESGFRKVDWEIYPPGEIEPREMSEERADDGGQRGRKAQERSSLKALRDYRRLLPVGDVYEFGDEEVLSVDAPEGQREPEVLENKYRAMQVRVRDAGGTVRFEASISDNPVEGWLVIYRSDASSSGAPPEYVAKECSAREARSEHGARLIMHATPDGVDPDQWMVKKIMAAMQATPEEFRKMEFWGIKPDGSPRIRYSNKLGKRALNPDQLILGQEPDE